MESPRKKMVQQKVPKVGGPQKPEGGPPRAPRCGVPEEVLGALVGPVGGGKNVGPGEQKSPEKEKKAKPATVWGHKKLFVGWPQRGFIPPQRPKKGRWAGKKVNGFGVTQAQKKMGGGKKTRPLGHNPTQGGAPQGGGRGRGSGPP